MSDMKNNAQPNNISEASIDPMLNHYEIAPPSDLLSARIMKSARLTLQDTELPQDNIHVQRNMFKVRRYVAAACLIAVATIFALLNLNTPVTKDSNAPLWKEAATDLGLSDIYEWVEDESTAH